MPAGDPRRAFVVMAFKPDLDELFDRVVRPALEDAGFQAERADSFLDQRAVLHDIIVGISEAELVVAELSEPNPNVYYELGVAHALGKRTVLIAQSMDMVPFDLKPYRVITYSRDFTAIDQLRKKLSEVAAAADHLEFGNPVSDYLQRPRESGDHAATAAPSGQGGDADEGDDERPQGWLDALVGLEENAERVTELMESIGEYTDEMAQGFVSRTSELEALSASGPPSPVDVRRVAQQVAGDMVIYAQRLEQVVPALEQRAEELVDAGLVLAEAMGETDVASDDAAAYREGFETLRDASREALANVVEFDGLVRELSKVSRDLRQAGKRLRADLKRIAGVLERIDASAERAIDLIAGLDGRAASA